jgi:hypothetical protein
MKKVFFGLSILTSILFFTNCGNQNQEAKEVANNKPLFDAAVTPIEAAKGVQTWNPNQFTLTLAEDTTEVIDRDGGDCFKGKGQYHIQRLTSIVTVTVGKQTYAGKLEGISNWGTGKFEPNCGGFDPDRAEYLQAKKYYTALADKNITPNDLKVTIEDGKLTKVTVLGRALTGNLKKPDVTVQLASF